MLPENARSDRDERLYAALADCLEAKERDPSLLPDDLALRHPEFASDVRGFLEVSRKISQWTEALRAESNPKSFRNLDARVGEWLGDYELLEELGHGGSGTVYKARKRDLQRSVALKVVNAASERVLRRFRLEVEVVATLDHPNIVPIYDVGEIGGRLYFAMKYFEGGSLAEFFASQKDSAFDTKYWCSLAILMSTVARAVHFAHQQSVIHRDLKPANILLDAEQRPYVADFGLARRLDAEGGLTPSGASVGTPGYMAPEQILCQNPGQPAVDIYSLGAILYEGLTGQQPHHGETPIESLFRTIQREPSPPRALVADVPFDLETICMKCLERKPENRYETTKDLADDLERWHQGRAILARRPSPRERLIRWAHRHRFTLRAAAAVALIVAFALAALQNERATHAEARQRAECEARTALALQNYYATIALADRERAAENSGLAERLLDQCPMELRGWEWDYLRRQRVGNTAPQQFSSHLFCLAISGDERRFAAGGSDGSILLGDPSGVEPCGHFQAHSQQVRGVAISPDATMLASAGFDGWVRLWDLRSHQCLHEWYVGGVALGVAFSPQGNTLAASTDGDEGIHRWDVRTGLALPLFTGLKGVIRKVAFRPNGDDLAAVNDLGQIVVWNTTTGAIRLSFSAHDYLVFDLQYSNSGHQFVTAAGQFYMHGQVGEVKMWDSTTGELRRAIRSPSGAYYAAALSPDGCRLFAAGEDSLVRVWDPVSGLEAITLRGHREAVWGLALSKDGRRCFTVSGDHAFRVWDATPSPTSAIPEPSSIAMFDATISAAVLSPDDRWVAVGSLDGLVQIIDAKSGTQIRALPRRAGPVHSLALTRDGKCLAVACWRRFNEESATGLVSLWDTETWAEGLQPQFSDVGALGIAFSPDERSVLVAADYSAIVIDRFSGQTTTRERRASLVTAVAWGSLASAIADADGNVIIRNTAARDSTRVIRTHTGRVPGLAFSPDGLTLASAGHDGAIRLWDIETGQLKKELSGHAGGTFAVTFTADGNRLVSGGHDATLRIWDPASGSAIRFYRGHRDAIHAVVVQSNGKSVLTGGRDRTILQWDLGSNLIPLRK